MEDAIVVGSGPNGFAAAITLARAGFSVRLIEGAPSVGGGMRTESLTLPGFLHDSCSAIHPFGTASPFFRSLPLADLGVEWIHAPLPLAHPLGDGRPLALHRSLDETCADLGVDGDAWRRAFGAWCSRSERLLADLLRPVGLPRDPIGITGFARLGLRSAEGLARSRFSDSRARSLFAGLAAHSSVPLHRSASAAIGLILGGLAHANGWPFPRGGAGAITRALDVHFRQLGGVVETGRWVDSLADLDARIVMLDVSVPRLLDLGRDRFPSSYRRALERFRPGPGVVKVDYALSGPAPWADHSCVRAATVHVGGTLAEIAAGEADVARGRIPDHPFVLVTQPSLFDSSRAPAGKHTLWAYTHVPNGWLDSSAAVNAIERQLDRFAPGFRDLVLARTVRDPAALERNNPNYVGGDIGGGSNDLRQMLARPASVRRPYATPIPGVYLCSSSTPPGGGVHGMCGHNAARAALRDLERGRAT